MEWLSDDGPMVIDEDDVKKIVKRAKEEERKKWIKCVEELKERISQSWAKGNESTNNIYEDIDDIFKKLVKGA